MIDLTALEQAAKAATPPQPEFEDEPDDDGMCPECGQGHDECECHAGAECGRWRNGRLSASCAKAGSEECDFECPHRDTLRF